MISFKSIASSSAGNAYLVEAPGVSPLLLEAGLPIRKLREALDFGLTGLDGCLISHEHQDHSRAVKDLIKSGIDCWMSKGTAEALSVYGHHRVSMFDGYQDGESIGYLESKIGSWTVKPFALEHDAEEPTGFVISYGNERLLFIPDTAYVENRFERITLAAIECNHIGDILINNVINEHLPAVVARRIRRNHMSLEQVINLLKANDLSSCRSIVLLHLSDGNSNAERMKLEVQQATGIPTTIAD